MITEKQKTDILNMNETDSYFLIDECGAFIFRMSHEMAHGKIPEESHAAIREDIIGVREVQKFVVDNLMKFGVDPKSAEDRKDGDYWKWFRFWDNWKKSLSDEDWNTINMLIKNNKSYDKHLPEGTWKD